MLRLIFFVLPFLHTPDSPVEAVQFWQRALGLQHWIVTVEVVSARQLDHATLGDIEPDRKSRIAHMRLLRIEDSALRGRSAVAEQLNTVLHEMVHLRKFAAEEHDWRIEAAVDREATLLLRQHGKWFERLAYEPAD